ncbi:MAG TPA: VCBS repeat-containing protein [Polyangia bacterium]
MSPKSRSLIVTSLLCCAAGVASIHCGFSGGASGSGGSSGGTGGSGAAGQSGSGGTSSTSGTGGTTETGSGGTTGTDAGAGSGGAAMSGSGGTTSMGGTSGNGGAAMMGTFKNYEVSGTFPTEPVAIVQKTGMLKFTKKVIHNKFLAESCSIGDYNNDGIPDVSSGRIWYQGPDFTVQHPFRSGHGVLPSNGDGPEINTGVSDDWADYPFDMNGDGWADIINVAQCDVNEITDTNPKIGTVQVHATAVWYQNPGSAAGLAGDPMWVSHLMHSDVRLEQHGLVDMNGDGYPEIYGACKGCTPAETKGYYQGDPHNPNAGWIFHSVTVPYTFPFSGTGWLHGLGAGDVNGDGKPDLLERGGIWLAQGTAASPTWNSTVCTGVNTPAGCGWIKTNLYDGLPDADGNKGASHMYAVDMDKDGKVDIVAANWAHGVGLYWYKQGANGQFTKYQFMGDSALDVPADPAKWGAGFTEPHSLQVVDMDGDGRPDVVTGKMRFAHPHGYGDPDSDSTPYLYVFKNVATPDAKTGSPITLQPILVDGDPTKAPGTTDGGMGVGRQLAVGHVNTDGIMDICVGTKVGLAVFLGQ